MRISIARVTTFPELVTAEALDEPIQTFRFSYNILATSVAKDYLIGHSDYRNCSSTLSEGELWIMNP